MTAVAPGGALRGARTRPGALLPALKPVLRPVLGPMVRPVRPVLRAARGAVVPSRVPAPSPSADDALAPPRELSPAAPADRPALSCVRGPSRPAASRRRRVLVPLAAAAGVGVLAWALLASPYGTVRSVEVTGASQRWAPAVRAAAAAAVGRPLLLARDGDIRARVAAVPGVRSAVVGVRWPGVLTVAVVERPAAVAVPVPGGVRLFAADGVDLGLELAAPAGLPLLSVPPAAVGPRTVLAAEQARQTLPATLAAEVVRMGATSPDGVWFGLRGGGTVVWGGAGDGAAKAQMLAALRRSVPAAPGTTFDVSAPDAPAVSTP
jgi:cell division protein FtsQ